MSKAEVLRDYSRSRAVLVGTWGYRYLPQLPAARHSLERMRDVLTGPWCGWPGERVEVFGDEPSPGELPDRLLTAFEDAADVALFYYVGHGQIDDEDQLALSLAGSRFEAHRRASTGLPFAAVRRALTRSPATMKLLILDCCFAGLATRREHALGASGAHLLELTGGTGAYTMAASGAYTTAWFETDPGLAEPQTYFTRYLADLVETGLPGQPAGVRLEPFFAQLRENLARDQRPVPVARSVDSARDFVFVRNAAPPEVLVDLADEVRRLGRELTAAATRERRLRAEAEARTEELHRLRTETRAHARDTAEDGYLQRPTPPAAAKRRRALIVAANVLGIAAASTITWTLARATLAPASRPITTATQHAVAAEVSQTTPTATRSPTPTTPTPASPTHTTPSSAASTLLISVIDPHALPGEQSIAFDDSTFTAPHTWSSKTVHLDYQPDGHLVLYCTATGTVLWTEDDNTGVHWGGPWVSPPGTLAFQDNGDLVIRGTDGNVFVLYTGGAQGIAYAKVQNDGNFVFYGRNGSVKWSSSTTDPSKCPAIAHG